MNRKNGAESAPASFPEQVVASFGSIENGIAWFEDNLNKEPVDYRLNLQVLTNLIGQEERAFAISNQLMMIAPDDPRVLFNRGWHMMKRGQFQEGFSLVENGRLLGAFGNSQPVSPMPILNDDAKLSQRAHILLALEGGLGDEMINVRFIRNIYKRYGKKTIIACHPSLIPLFAKLPEAAAVIGHPVIPGVYHDYWIPGMSAPSRLCDSLSDVGGQEPYLFVNELPNLLAWKQLVAKKSPGQTKNESRYSLVRKLSVRASAVPPLPSRSAARFAKVQGSSAIQLPARRRLDGASRKHH